MEGRRDNDENHLEKIDEDNVVEVKTEINPTSTNTDKSIGRGFNYGRILCVTMLLFISLQITLNSLFFSFSKSYFRDEFDLLSDILVKQIQEQNAVYIHKLRTLEQKCVSDIQSRFESCFQPETTEDVESEKAKLELMNIELKQDLKNEIHSTFQRELSQIQYADGINRIDYASISMGGEIVDYSHSYDWMKAYIWRKIPGFTFKKWLMKRVSQPEAVITQNTALGECFPLEGSIGYFTIKLPIPVYPDGFSLDHVSKTMSPDPTSAPKKIRVWGYHSRRKDPDFLGEYEYDFSSVVQTWNYVPSGSEDTGYPVWKKAYVQYKVEIVENHGHEEFTCVYRFRIHGERKRVKKKD